MIGIRMTEINENDISDEIKHLQEELYKAINRAERAALEAERAALKAKKIAKKVKKSKLKIKLAQKQLVDFQHTTDEKTKELRDEIIEIASKAIKKNKALKKIAKMNSDKN